MRTIGTQNENDADYSYHASDVEKSLLPEILAHPSSEGGNVRLEAAFVNSERQTEEPHKSSMQQFCVGMTQDAEDHETSVNRGGETKR